MPDAITLETVQAMQAMQLSMAYSTAVTKMSMDAEQTAAENLIQMMPQPVSTESHLIDVYA